MLSRSGKKLTRHLPLLQAMNVLYPAQCLLRSTWDVACPRGDQEPTCLPCPPTGCQLPWPCCLFQALHAREKDVGASSPRGWAGTAVGGILNGGLEFLVFHQEIKLQIHPTWGAFWQVLPTGEADPAAMAQQGIPNGQAPPFLPTWQGHGAHPSCPTGVRVRRYLFGLDKPPSCQDFKKLPQLGKAFVD